MVSANDLRISRFGASLSGDELSSPNYPGIGLPCCLFILFEAFKFIYYNCILSSSFVVFIRRIDLEGLACHYLETGMAMSGKEEWGVTPGLVQ